MAKRMTLEEKMEYWLENQRLGKALETANATITDLERRLAEALESLDRRVTEAQAAEKRAVDKLVDLRRELAEAQRDGERLDWLEAQSGVGLISDDFGHWAVSGDGMQNVPRKTPADIQTTFFVKAADWTKAVRAAIDAARKEGV